MVKNKTDIISSNYILPFNNEELESFSKKYKLNMMNHVISSIEFSIKNNTPTIEVFQFKDSDFVIILEEKDYIPNLDNILSYYIGTEKYEYCSEIIKLKEMLSKKQNNNEK